MAVSKVVYGEETLLDLTADTVTESTLLSGTTAHNAKGALVTGTLASGRPEYVATVEECTDQSKIYLLPDGYLYYYGETEAAVEPENILPYTNNALNTRISSSGTTANNGYYITDFVSIPFVDGECTLRINGINIYASANIVTPNIYRVAYYDSSNNFLKGEYILNACTQDGNDKLFKVGYSNAATKLAYYDQISKIRFSVQINTNGRAITEADIVQFTVKPNTTATATVGGFVSTGVKYANYAMTENDAEQIVNKMLDRLDVSYVSSDKVLTVGTYTFRYDGTGVADIGVSE